MYHLGLQLHTVALMTKDDEPRFLQWTRSVGLARSEEYRAFIARYDRHVVLEEMHSFRTKQRRFPGCLQSPSSGLICGLSSALHASVSETLTAHPLAMC